ncbi:WecB/TagA/CpsF family glycosyltransferase [Oscillatoria sp. CS-180]|uniref:WecB/TagA/CpsF family glycosyltransferase n=1 Tax=Oscillatoria sp. CS-180 TaxID=3021720 RepID=UPI00232B39B0|nr:WecB/TagA/CpsF family glycosyltransferase [Oscillatoria sp. CS-180]MDB9526414.1 WecB/TagA/CpsF family glycosyltransferase [Oscillatoria sp. CS-180]
MNFPKVEVTGTPVTALTLGEQISVMVDWAKRRCSKVVCVANVHMLMESRWNQSFSSILAKADLVTPDGMPLVWVMRKIGAKSQDRVAGMDIFQSVCDKAVQEGLSVYLFGSTPPVLSKMQERLKQDYPDLKLAGVESPPFRALTESENAAIAQRINASGAGFTFVSLGCPKQEIWMEDQRGKVNSVMIGVGAVFPVYARVKKHAPKWVRESGLEWFYRLLQEPRRLFGRYLKTIPPFVWLAFRQLQSQNR